MHKILGIDTGTNSLGWAIVEKLSDGYRLIDKGVNIFQEGVNIEKGIESSKASERTGHRSIRIGYYRRKLRKIRLLRILSDNHLCPPLTAAQLSAWRLKKVYPTDELFMDWQLTDDNVGQNPYAYRHKCLHERLDLSNLTDRYILGRALYHLNQRRGFLSNRKDSGGDDSGTVKQGISTLTEEMHAEGCEYLGDYFYILYQRGKKIRKHYTARNEHYLAEFKAICERQGLDASLVAKLENAIFYQRPLKSQKGLVGKCLFEPKKTKCPSSHPRFEEFRMLSFLNNVKVKTPDDEQLRPLNEEERKKALLVFFLKSKSKPVFDFEDIAKNLAPKKQYGYIKNSADQRNKDWLFNYPMDTPVSGCPVTAELKNLFGDDWVQGICEVYTLAEGKSAEAVVNDVWHALYFYSDSDKLAEFAQNRLQLSEEDAKKFSNISMPSTYAMLSLKAINKMLPYLRMGYIYSHAVFLANLGKVMPRYEWTNPDMRQVAIEGIVDICQHHDIARSEHIHSKDSETEPQTLEKKIRAFLMEKYNVSGKALAKLYHPSMIEVYKRAEPNEDGIYQLGSPRLDNVRNPMAMRSLFRLRKLVNRLLQKGMIDEDTEVHVEFARELNDANKRKAIREMNLANQKKRADAAKEIKDLYKKETGKDIEPNEAEVLKYLLWVEQDHQCLYTGHTIGITEFVGADPKYDIEHTIPQSVGGDSTMENLTLCESRFNRDVKRTKIPTELSNYCEILQRIAPWKEKYEKLDAQIRKNKRATKGATTKEQKDKFIVKRRGWEMERNYWRGKYNRFTMETIPEGFSRRQGTDISLISKYARLYLRSVFRHVYTVKGLATSDFRKLWGIQDEYAKKERVNHVHHCIDAIVIACIGLDEYGQLAAYYHTEEEYRWHCASKPHFPKPWPTFVEDLKRVQNEILVYHYTADKVSKQAYRFLKKEVVDGNLKKVYAKMDVARGALHKDTYYGAIKRDSEDVRYVKRVPLDMLSAGDVKNIVDDTVRGIIESAINEKGFKKAMDGPIWMNEEKQIPIKKVRCYSPSVTNPLHIRSQRDSSAKDYKKQYHVANDSNYLMAIYIGKDAKGKERRDFEMVNLMQAARFYRAGKDRTVHYGIVPEKSRRDYPLGFTLKVGTLVLLYENNAEEIWEASAKERSCRLYKITGLSSMVVGDNSYGTIIMRHHEEARPATELKAKNGAYKQGEEFRSSIKMLHTQIQALVQGVDFTIDETGQIRKLR